MRNKREEIKIPTILIFEMLLKPEIEYFCGALECKEKVYDVEREMI